MAIDKEAIDRARRYATSKGTVGPIHAWLRGLLDPRPPRSINIPQAARATGKHRATRARKRRRRAAQASRRANRVT